MLPIGRRENARRCKPSSLRQATFRLAVTGEKTLEAKTGVHYPGERR
jgi:hypothetical protein